MKWAELSPSQQLQCVLAAILFPLVLALIKLFGL